MPLPALLDSARRTECLRRLALAVLLAAAWLAIAPAADAQGDSSSLCEAPLERLQAMASARPHDAETHARLGRCYLAIGRTDIAHKPLRRAAEIEPTPNRRIEVAVALYHDRRLHEADALLDELVGTAGDRADTHFYKGLILLERGADAEAAARLDHARRLDPGRVEPVASYFAGISYSNAGDRARAEEALERIAADWDGTQWSEAARVELGRLRNEKSLNHWFEASTGIEFDSNVSLTGRSVLPNEISEDTDGRSTVVVRGGSELKGHDWYAGAGASYHATYHYSGRDFDVQYPSLTLYGAHRLGDQSVLRFQVDSGYAWVGYDPFVFTYDSTLALDHDWESAGATEWFVDFLFRDYENNSADIPGGPGAGLPCPGPNPPRFCGPFDIDEKHERDRDGWGIRTGIAHRVPAPEPLSELRLLAAIERYDSEGAEYEHDGIEGGIRAVTELAHGLTGTFNGSYRALFYDHRSTFPDRILNNDSQYRLSGSDRREHVVDARLELEQKLLYDLALVGRYRFERRFSNTRVYDYDRHVVGMYVTWRPRLGTSQ